MARWYPSLDDVLEFHTVQLELFGGAPGVRDMGLVEMGLFRPQTGYYKAVSYTHLTLPTILLV